MENHRTHVGSKNYLTTEEAARFLNMSPATLAKWRTNGGGPRFRKFGRAARYALSDLEAYVGQRGFDSTSEPHAGPADAPEMVDGVTAHRIITRHVEVLRAKRVALGSSAHKQKWDISACIDELEFVAGVIDGSIAGPEAERLKCT